MQDIDENGEDELDNQDLDNDLMYDNEDDDILSE